jgi:putative effector of murein hydrolase LrgA (UPF0299 family)
MTWKKLLRPIRFVLLFFIPVGIALMASSPLHGWARMTIALSVYSFVCVALIAIAKRKKLV